MTLPGDLTERMMRALLIEMIRSEAIPARDVEAAIVRLDKDGDKEASHALSCILMRSIFPDESEMTAQHRRDRFRVVSDGGNLSE